MFREFSPCDPSGLAHLGSGLDSANILLVGFDAEVPETVILEQSIGSSDINAVSNLHALEVLGHFSTVRELGMSVLEVNLDDELEIAEIIVRRDRCVRSDN